MVVSNYSFFVTDLKSGILEANGILGTAACVSIQHGLSLCYLMAVGNSNHLIVMIAENVSVGILSLPSAVATLGMVPYVFDP